MIGRAYARASGLLQEGFAHGGDGLRGYYYCLLAGLDEWGPASQAALGRGTGIDRSDITAALGVPVTMDPSAPLERPVS